MKVYLAVITTDTLMEGSSQEVIGVFSSKKKAAEAFKENYSFEEAEQIGDFSWRNIFDGELAYYFDVIEAILDEKIY